MVLGWFREVSGFGKSVNRIYPAQGNQALNKDFKDLRVCKVALARDGPQGSFRQVRSFSTSGHVDVLGLKTQIDPA